MHTRATVSSGNTVTVNDGPNPGEKWVEIADPAPGQWDAGDLVGAELTLWDTSSNPHQFIIKNTTITGADENRKLRMILDDETDLSDFSNSAPYLIKDADAVYTYHTDAQGNVVAISDATGRVIEKIKYDVYGRITDFQWWNGTDYSNATKTDGFVTAQTYYTCSLTKNPYLFQGRRLDEETGLYYFRNRYYDPEHGRFISRDPEGFIDGPNLYAFVNNNPINYVDPMGLDKVKIKVKIREQVPDGTYSTVRGVKAKFSVGAYGRLGRIERLIRSIEELFEGKYYEFKLPNYKWIEGTEGQEIEEEDLFGRIIRGDTSIVDHGGINTALVRKICFDLLRSRIKQSLPGKVLDLYEEYEKIEQLKAAGVDTTEARQEFFKKAVIVLGSIVLAEALFSELNEETGYEEGDEEVEEMKKKTFPEDPNEFDPGEDYEKREYKGKKGKVVKWFKKGSDKAEWEYDEDPQHGGHYHKHGPDGKTREKHPTTGDTHMKPGDIIPGKKIDEVEE